MFGCSMDGDLSNTTVGSGDFHSVDSNVLKISIFTSGEFGQFMSEYYSDVGFDFMERTFTVGSQTFVCKLNLCGK